LLHHPIVVKLLPQSRFAQEPVRVLIQRHGHLFSLPQWWVKSNLVAFMHATGVLLIQHGNQETCWAVFRERFVYSGALG
jgi:hypothetical protein